MGGVLTSIALGFLSVVGVLYILATIISYMVITKADRYDEGFCDCGCGQSLPMDLCSSECDDKCKENNHFEGSY